MSLHPPDTASRDHLLAVGGPFSNFRIARLRNECNNLVYVWHVKLKSNAARGKEVLLACRSQRGLVLFVSGKCRFVRCGGYVLVQFVQIRVVVFLRSQLEFVNQFFDQ